MIAAFPGFGGIIVDDEEVAVIEAEVAFGGGGKGFATGEQRGPDRLEVGAGESACGDEGGGTGEWVIGSEYGERSPEEWSAGGIGGGCCDVRAMECWDIRHGREG